jgi:hypothetical protein
VRNDLGTLTHYDFICVPLLYTQVSNLKAMKTFFPVMLFPCIGVRLIMIYYALNVRTNFKYFLMVGDKSFVFSITVVRCLIV